MKKTLVVNLFGGPGTGKSTGAAYIFSRLKLEGVDAELVTEYAKDKVWEKNSKVFDCQMYLSGKQLWKIKRCLGEVDVIVTDSPILQGCIYLDENDPLRKALIKEHFKMSSLNIMLHRVKAYNPNGRNQTEEEAEEMDEKIRHMLFTTTKEFAMFDADLGGYDSIVMFILNYLKENE